MPQPMHMTDIQIERMAIVIADLARRGNAWGIGINQQIAGKSTAEKRYIILGAYGQMYEAMLCLQMVLQSNRAPADIAARLQSGGKHHG